MKEVYSMGWRGCLVTMETLCLPSLPDSLDKEDRSLYFQTLEMAECLAGLGYSVDRLSVSYVPQVTGKTR